MAAPADDRLSGISDYLVVATFGIGFTIQLIGYSLHPDGWRGFVGFGVIYGWLLVFTLFSKRFPRKRRTLLVVGGMPLFLLGIASIVLSFPIYVLPAIVLAFAIANVKDAS
jgi:dolichol kinase